MSPLTMSSADVRALEMQYALDTVHLADDARPDEATHRRRYSAAPRRPLSPAEHAAEASRYREIAARKRACADEADAKGWSSGETFRSDAQHFDRLAATHESKSAPARARQEVSA